jgi:hypothetical protein
MVVATTVALTNGAQGAIVALADQTGFASTTTLHQDFKNAFTNNTLVTKTNATQDTYLGNSGDSRWANYGINPLQGSSNPFLMKFDLASLGNFSGGTINRAELRIKQNNGNSGTRTVGYITTFDWAEGNKSATEPGDAVSISAGNQAAYPGSQIGDVIPSAPGASLAHPAGVHDAAGEGANSAAANSLTNPAQTWGSGNDFFNYDAITSDLPNFVVAPVDGVTPGDGTSYRTMKGIDSSFLVYDVTDIVTLWAAGIANKGFVLKTSGGNNYQYRTSEYSATDQPVLFLDYTPGVPEPTTMGLLGAGAMMALRRRRRS